ncbi:hypothetical protein ACFLSI_05555 [Bacteroidota bacterium]
MKKEFKCRKCNTTFKADPVRKEYIDPVYGPCFKFVAECPDCKQESGEYIKPKPQKANSKPDIPSCASGSCLGCPGMQQ